MDNFDSAYDEGHNSAVERAVDEIRARSAMEISKSDWKLFREKIPEWQESYMERLNQEYIKLLNGEGSAAHRFWALDERIKQDRRKPGVIVEMSKSKVIWNIIALLQDGAITSDELNDFSDDLKDAVTFFTNRQ